MLNISIGPSTAVYIKTGSGDEKLFSYSRSFTDEEFCTKIKEEMGDEFEDIGCIMVTSSVCRTPDTKHTWDEIYKNWYNYEFLSLIDI